MPDIDQVNAVLDAYVDAWNRMDFAALGSLWDSSSPDLYYVAEEVDHALHGFAAIDAYWQRTAATVEFVRIRIEDRRVRQLADDIVVATWGMHVEASMRGYEAQGFSPVGSDVKVTAILRRCDGDWRFIHYVEAPLGALPFVRRVYNSNVSGD